MGKITNYHPVSLHVLRGSAEYGGFKLGRIRQEESDVTTATARYTCEVTAIPEAAKYWREWRIYSALRDCYMDDIAVTNLWRTKSGTLMCNITVALNVPYMLDEIVEDLEEAL